MDRERGRQGNEKKDALGTQKQEYSPEKIKKDVLCKEEKEELPTDR